MFDRREGLRFGLGADLVQDRLQSASDLFRVLFHMFYRRMVNLLPIPTS